MVGSLVPALYRLTWESRCCHLLSGWLWASYFSSLNQQGQDTMKQNGHWPWCWHGLCQAQLWEDGAFTV